MHAEEKKTKRKKKKEDAEPERRGRKENKSQKRSGNKVSCKNRNFKTWSLCVINRGINDRDFKILTSKSGLENIETEEEINNQVQICSQ